MIVPSWQQGVDMQLHALTILRKLIEVDPDRSMRRQWQIDLALLQTAKPYCWSGEPIAACLRASASVPADTQFDMWNVPTDGSSWWFFDTPLDIPTTSEKAKIRAISFGWIGDLPRRHFKSLYDKAELDTAMVQAEITNAKLVVAAWIDHATLGLSPSQVFTWHSGESIEAMLVRVKLEHEETYGPGGPLSHKPQVGGSVFIEAAEAMGRFVLAGLTWMRQRVVVEAAAPLERHARKRYQRETGQQDEPRVRVVSLRRAEPRPDDGEHTEGSPREWSCRWMVGLEEGGFWRHQPCGPRGADRRLTFIAPFMKGPEDKPLRLPAKKVHVVNR